MLSKRVRSLRKAAGLTQKGLARAIKKSQASISAIERGDTKKLSGEMLARLCVALKTNNNYLLNGSGDSGPSAVDDIERREILDIWAALDPISRESLVFSARVLLDRQNRGEPSIHNPYPAQKAVAV